ncbi:hypothetical protein [Nocardiopsis synnemataformans]|uniref:hypothetical protein n=1 Tax=Nocardiopsis synnemataformans TaxID=61305 RepID=UPI003EBE90E7
MTTLSPVRSRRGRGDYTPIFGSVGIAAGLLAVSFTHIYDFVLKAGNPPWSAVVIAGTVDITVVLAISTLTLARNRGVAPSPWAKPVLIGAMVATVGANVYHGVAYGWQGIAVAIWVPFAAEGAFQLAMWTLRTLKSTEASMTICGGHRIPVAAVTARVTADRTAAELATAEERERLAARPVLCGRTVPMAAVMERVTAARVAAELAAAKDAAALAARPVICGRWVAVADVAMPKPRPVICGQLIPEKAVAEHLAVATVAGTRPTICGDLVTLSALTASLADDRLVICGQLVTAAEVMAMTPVAAPKVGRAATGQRTAKRSSVDSGHRPAPKALTVDRERAVMDWLTEPGALDDRLTTASGEDVATLLAVKELGFVSERTGRRILAAAKKALREKELAAA